MKLILKFLRILVFRLRHQGLRVTLLWIYGRFVPRLTGIPMQRYSQVTPQVFVGAQYNSTGLRRLAEWGIDSVVNLRTEFNDAAHGLAPEYYLHLPVVDDDAPTMEQMERGVNFIRQSVSRGGKVYIHCAGGVGRAPTLAAAYFVNQGMHLDEAVSLIQRARPFINIMPAQMQRLQEFARDGR